MSKIQRVFFTTNNMVLDNFEYPHIDSSGQAFCPLARVSTSNISWLLFGGFLHHESQGENISNFIQMVKVQFQTRNLLLDTFETTDRRSAIISFSVKGSVPTKSQWNVWYFAKPPGLGVLLVYDFAPVFALAPMFCPQCLPLPLPSILPLYFRTK